jgi:hypothetical protein
VDALYEQIVFYGAGISAIIVGLFFLGPLGVTGIPEILVLLGFGSLLTGSVVK